MISASVMKGLNSLNIIRSKILRRSLKLNIYSSSKQTAKQPIIIIMWRNFMSSSVSFKGLVISWNYNTTIIRIILSWFYGDKFIYFALLVFQEKSKKSDIVRFISKYFYKETLHCQHFEGNNSCQR